MLFRSTEGKADGDVPRECPAIVTFFVLCFLIAFCTAARTPEADLERLRDRYQQAGRTNESAGVRASIAFPRSRCGPRRSC